MNEMYENNVASSTSTKEKCPYCGGVIEAGSRFCGRIRLLPIPKGKR